MSVYNIEGVDPLGIESILAQTFVDFELIIVNDGSTDATQRIVAGYEQLDSRVHVFALPTNLGLAGALNAGLAACQAGLIARMDIDDEADPFRLEKQVNWFEVHPETDVVSSNFFRRFDDTAEERLVRLPEWHEEIVRGLSYASTMCHGGSMIRRWCFDELGTYDSHFRRAQDYELWMRWRGSVTFHNLQEPLLRVHALKHGWRSLRNTSKWSILKYELLLRFRSIRQHSQYRLRDVYGVCRLLMSNLINVLRTQ